MFINILISIYSDYLKYTNKNNQFINNIYLHLYSKDFLIHGKNLYL